MEETTIFIAVFTTLGVILLLTFLYWFHLRSKTKSTGKHNRSKVTELGKVTVTESQEILKSSSQNNVLIEQPANLGTSPANSKTGGTHLSNISKKSADKNLFTLTVGQKELSIPAYLEVTPDVDFSLSEKIGKGGNSIVYVAHVNGADLQKRCEGIKCVAKVLKFEDEEQDRPIFHQEIAMMSFFASSRNFAKLVGYCENPPIICLKHYVMGSLSDWIKKGHKMLPYSSRSVLRFTTNIAVGIKDLHENDFVHCDIKPGNILLNADPQVGFHAVLTDFGIARVLDETSVLVEAFRVVKKDGWSINYCPPEAFEKFFRADGDTETSMASGVTVGDECTQHALKSADIFMLAMTMFEMIFRIVPYNNLPDTATIVKAIWTGQRPEVGAEDLKAVQNDPLLRQLLDVMYECWNFNPEERPEPVVIIQKLRQMKSISRKDSDQLWRTSDTVEAHSSEISMGPIRKNTSKSARSIV